MKPARRLVLLGLAAGAAFVAIVPASAGATRAGDAVIVSGDGDQRPLHSGDATTPFTIRLPRSASCPGDSADAGYRVQSFLVPADVEPGALRYKSLGPDVDGGYALYDTHTRTFVQAQTAKADPPERAGVIVNIPSFDFAVYPSGTLHDGEYRLGIACTVANQTERFWDTSIALATSSGDDDGRIRWRVAIRTSSSGDAGRGPSALRTALAALVLVLGTSISFVRWKRRRAPLTSHLEDQ